MIEAVSCGGVVIYKWKILLLYKNQNGRYMGWVLPKGTVEEGETYRQTALREVKEESGANGEIIKYVGKTQYTFKGSEDTVNKTVHWYLMSANAISAEGVLVNIDGTGNRISAAAGAHETVCYLVGRNKIAPTFQQALWRARNIAAPLNARRLHRKTPCAQGETLRCYDCRSPERICNGLSVLWRPLGGVGETLVCLVGEDLGY